jgi:hypothetical protein
MLIPLTPGALDQLIPRIATASQYRYVWGKSRELLQRLLISLLIVVSIWIVSLVFGHGAQGIELICYIVGGLYWFWAPIYVASLRNAQYRRYAYGGFWRGEVLDVYITEELINEEQRANEYGELVIIENCERRVNVEVADDEGFNLTIHAPVKRLYKSIAPGQTAELLLLSQQADLDRVAKVSDLYLPQLNLWVGEYPYLRRDLFQDMSRRFAGSSPQISSAPSGPKRQGGGQRRYS